MIRKTAAGMILLCIAVAACSSQESETLELTPPGPGPYPVSVSNLEVKDEFNDIGNDAMHAILLGVENDPDEARFLTDILQNPDAAWITEVEIPEEEIYGPAGGTNLPVVSYIVFPSAAYESGNAYTFPYFNGEFGVIQNMLQTGEVPRFADHDGQYPLVVLAHGASAHGVYEIAHAQKLASHGYIVVVLTYGDDRTSIGGNLLDHHVAFLRPLITSVVIDSVLDDDVFGPRVDKDNIGISGHSFGGFTSLAISGGPYIGNSSTVKDERIKAAVAAAPWVGHEFQGEVFNAFGEDNNGLSGVGIPVLSLFGTADDVTEARFILPAMKQLSGDVYVIELVDQPHVFEGPSWQDKDAWELVFFDAYLKGDEEALAMLRDGSSMKDGGEDRQLMEYQRVVSRSH